MKTLVVLLILLGGFGEGFGEVFDLGYAAGNLAEGAPVFALASDPCAKKCRECADGDAKEGKDLGKNRGNIHDALGLFLGIVTGSLVMCLGITVGRKL